jgi:uncharacterized protein YycO
LNIKPADLIFTRSQTVTSAVIRFRTWGDYSHVMLCGKKWPEVISADAEGVTLRDMTEREFENPSSILGLPDLPEPKRWEILEWAYSQIGKGYDFLGLADFLINADVQSEDRFFCSELVFLSYKNAGIELLKRIDHAFVSPRDLYISPLLEVII